MIASELRIGNWVLGVDWEGNDEPLQVNLIENTDYGDIVKPIPLTEEWLIKFGFEKMPWDMRFRSEYYSKKYESDFKLSEMVDLVFRKDKNVFAFNMAGLHIKHVHQLQNLYFTLTGTELTIKE